MREEKTSMVTAELVKIKLNRAARGSVWHSCRKTGYHHTVTTGAQHTPERMERDELSFTLIHTVSKSSKQREFSLCASSLWCFNQFKAHHLKAPPCAAALHLVVVNTG